jgi:hypothetical protein
MLEEAEDNLDEAEGLFAEAEDVFYEMLHLMAGDDSWPRAALEDRESFFAEFDHLLERRSDYYEFFAELKELFTTYTTIYDQAVKKYNRYLALKGD